MALRNAVSSSSTNYSVQNLLARQGYINAPVIDNLAEVGAPLTRKLLAAVDVSELETAAVYRFGEEVMSCGSLHDYPGV
jgi:hypothetical protein